MARAAVDAAGIKKFARQMRVVDRKLGVATAAELRAIGNTIRDEIRFSPASPRAQSPSGDSQGRPGRKRKSIKTSVRAGGVALYSREPDAGVWNWGGSIAPRGTPIHIPRTEFVSGAVEKSAPKVEAGLLGMVDGICRRYAEFT